MVLPCWQKQNSAKRPLLLAESSRLIAPYPFHNVAFLWGILLLYAIFNAALAFTWVRMQPFVPLKTAATTSLSVVIVVRNEAATIGLLLDDLNRQTLPAARFEVLIADDGSTDGTLERVTQFIPQAQYSLRIFPLATDDTTLSPKKKGITEAIRLAKGELIVTTDGDCRVSIHWLALLEEFYRTRQARLISAGVAFTQEKSLFEKLQTVEFASLIGSGACALQWGFPTMCNGANLAYSKVVFAEVGGFSGIDHLASGDDELLMHKIGERYPGQLYFLKHPASVVHTQAQPSLSRFYQQRKRWASKWKAYRDVRISLLAIFIFLSNVGLIVAAGLCLTGRYAFSTFILQAAVKFLAEFIPLALFIRYLQPPRQSIRRIALLPLVQVLYPFYVVFFGLAAQRKGFVWKGRKMG